MLDSQGYLKLVDFGLAKDLMDGSKTFTVVGTAAWLHLPTGLGTVGFLRSLVCETSGVLHGA